MTIQTQPTTDNVSATLTDSAPSISSSAMLVELSISTWTGRKLDKQASQMSTRSYLAIVKNLMLYRNLSVMFVIYITQ